MRIQTLEKPPVIPRRERTNRRSCSSSCPASTVFCFRRNLAVLGRCRPPFRWWAVCRTECEWVGCRARWGRGRATGARERHGCFVDWRSVVGGGLLVDERIAKNRKKSQKFFDMKQNFSTCSLRLLHVEKFCYISKNFATCRTKSKF
jgi:hypothetical protein